jgi:DNA-binding beta-propeller fold protein YncE
MRETTNAGGDSLMSAAMTGSTIAGTARRGALTTLVMLLAALAVFALGSVSAHAALKSSFLRTSSIEVTEADAFDATGDIYHADETVVEKLSPAESAVEFIDSGVVPYVSGAKLTGTPEGPFGHVASVAVAADGDIYVADSAKNAIDIFEASGAFIEKWTGSNTPAKSFEQLTQVAVDSVDGRVYALDEGAEVVDVFDASGVYLFESVAAETPLQRFKGHGYGSAQIAVDDVTGELLVADEPTNGGKETGVIEVFGASGSYLASWWGFATPTGQFGRDLRLGLTIDQTNGDVLLADSANHDIDVFDAAGEYLSPQTAGIERPRSIAFDGATGELYVNGEIDVGERFVSEAVYGMSLLPDVAASAPSALQPTAATLSGQVDPEGVAAGECLFEYATVAAFNEGQAAEVGCEQQPGGGTGAVPVSAKVSGLESDTRYALRLDASDVNGVNRSETVTFFTSTAPLVEVNSYDDIGSAQATVSARVNAASLPTSYWVEYGPSAQYGASTHVVSAGDGEAPVGVQAQLVGLQPDTEYHFRFEASNADGTEHGPDETFTTGLAAGATSSALPDGRVYELVAAPHETEDWDVYPPLFECASSSEEGPEFLCGDRPTQAAEDGSELAFVGDPVPGSNGAVGGGLGDEFLASRSASGWTSTAITPSGTGNYGGVYQGFSSGLSVGVLESFADEPLAPGAPRCTTLYQRGGEIPIQPLFTKTQISAEEEEGCFGPQFAGASADGSVLAFEMPRALTPEAPGGGEGDLYEVSGGTLRLVNILPGGEPAGDAKFGSATSRFTGGVVSADGSRLIWTDLSDRNLYVREDGGTPSARTVLVAEDGEFLAAGADGSPVLYAKEGDLYSFDVATGVTSDLAPGSEVQGVVGVSEDGAYVYFVAHAALKGAGGAPLSNGQGSEPTAGEDNLYLLHKGTLSFIATLDGAADSSDWLIDQIWNEGLAETNAPDLYRTAEVAPGGGAVVFMSDRDLTGYDNARPKPGECEETQVGEPLQACDEVFVYDADTAKLACASCNESGAPIQAGGGLLSLPTGHDHLPRWIDEAGTEVFFDSAESLVSQAASGKMHVYEWQQQGAGGCQRPDGCIALLSSAEKEAYFLDAGAGGEDVFFATRADLVPRDRGNAAVIYDAHANGRPPLSPPACSGTGCQGLPSAPPSFATPASVTYEGVGNFAQSPRPTAVKPKVKRCAKGFVQRGGRCARRGRKHHAQANRKRRPRRVRATTRSSGFGEPARRGGVGR